MIDVNGVKLPFIPAGGIDGLKSTPKTKTNGNVANTPFQEFLDNEIVNLKFSGHASSRMNSRDLNLDEMELLRLETAVTKAEMKSAKESLVLLDDKALIVNIPNRTVITMFNKNQLNDSVITQIDSAVFA